MAKKPLISEEEYAKLRIREGNQIIKDRVPHCFGMPILTLPECNHQVGGAKYRNICELRHSCALAYAERLGVDVASVYSGERDKQYPALVGKIQEREREINYTPRIGRQVKSESEGVVPQESVVDEASMASLIDEPQVETGSGDGETTTTTRTPQEGSIRDLILRIIGAGEWMSKAQIIRGLEIELGREPLNAAAKHKISLTLLPKTQTKFGYKVERRVEEESGKKVHQYRLENATQEQAQVR